MKISFRLLMGRMLGLEKLSSSVPVPGKIRHHCIPSKHSRKTKPPTYIGIVFCGQSNPYLHISSCAHSESDRREGLSEVSVRSGGVIR